jgi:hypothetical protein
MAERVPRQLQLAVARRALYRCEYCQSPARVCPDSLSVEHVVPRSAGGPSESANLALACQGCNNRKYTATTALDPITSIEVPLFNPRLDRWEDHFAYSADMDRIIGLSPVGRATVERLQLNRDSVVNLRRLLRLERGNPSGSQSQP